MYIYIYMYREYIYVHFFHTDVKRNAAMASFAREGKGKVSEGLFVRQKLKFRSHI